VIHPGYGQEEFVRFVAVRRAEVRGFPYAVFYRYRPDRVDVLRVLHAPEPTQPGTQARACARPALGLPSAVRLLELSDVGEDVGSPGRVGVCRATRPRSGLPRAS
jgi:hypothetical protein